MRSGLNARFGSPNTDLQWRRWITALELEYFVDLNRVPFPLRSGLLRASHIKPWAADNREWVNAHNGLATYLLHDAAFDQGYLAVNGDDRIYEARVLQESVVQDRGMNLCFGDILSPSLILLQHAKRPADHCLVYHWQKIFKGL